MSINRWPWIFEYVLVMVNYPTDFNITCHLDRHHAKLSRIVENFAGLVPQLVPPIRWPFTYKMFGCLICLAQGLATLINTYRSAFIMKHSRQCPVSIPSTSHYCRPPKFTNSKVGLNLVSLPVCKDSFALFTSKLIHSFVAADCLV